MFPVKLRGTCPLKEQQIKIGEHVPPRFPGANTRAGTGAGTGAGAGTRAKYELALIFTIGAPPDL